MPYLRYKLDQSTSDAVKNGQEQLHRDWAMPDSKVNKFDKSMVSYSLSVLYMSCTCRYNYVGYLMLYEGWLIYSHHKEYASCLCGIPIISIMSNKLSNNIRYTVYWNKCYLWKRHLAKEDSKIHDFYSYPAVKLFLLGSFCI
jgi:hypothetical protein